MARKLFIKQWRKHRGKTQAAIADAMETSAASISRIENGVYGYTREKLEGIAAELQCEPGDLLKFDPQSPSYLLWLVFQRMSPHQQERALHILRATMDDLPVPVIPQPGNRRPFPKPRSSRSRRKTRI